MCDLDDALLDNLNPRQRDAVLYGDGPLLVLAGAGSGKTRVLTHRLAHLCRVRGVPAHRLLAFTFTNRAAREMRERILRMVGPAAGLWVGTIHAVCVRILRRHPELVGRSARFTIYDADDQRSVIKRCLRDLGFSEREFRPQVVHGLISAAKNRLESAEALAAAAAGGPQGQFQAQVARVYREYDRRLREADAFDFDDLILRTIELLHAEAPVLELYAERFRHVLVDEYQDTNHAQYVLITLLASRHRNLTAVGDDDQSIYSWRGADIRNILSFEETYPDAAIIRLEQNYRSTRRILRAANEVVKHNRGRKPKELWTENDEGEKLRLWLLDDEDAEAEALVGEIESACGQSDLGHGDCVILYRTHAQSRPIESALRRRGIRYEIVGGVSFYERREVKDVLAYLRLLGSPRDAVSFLRVIGVPRRGIGKTTVERLRAWARAAGLPLLAAARRAAEAPGLSGAAGRRLGDFCALIDRLAAGVGRPVPEQIQAVIESVHYVDYLEEDDPLTAEGRAENLDELAAAAAHFAEVSGDASLEGFLADVALVSDLDQVADEGDQVTLMSAHNAKGLEYELVMVAGLEQGLFPHASAIDDAAEMEEERRLFYVALTRARRQVVLSAARRRWRYGTSMEATVSDFVTELPADDLEVCDLSGGGGGRSRGQAGRAASWRAAGGRGRVPGGTGSPAAEHDPAAEVQLDPADGWGVVVGCPVWHAQFGRGTVVGQQGAGPEARLTVRFDGAVTRKLVARYLSLLEA